jgi:hypothetical protein
MLSQNGLAKANLLNMHNKGLIAPAPERAAWSGVAA